MATPSLAPHVSSTYVPLSEYLRTSYRPDCDWIAGEVRERNPGEGSHASIQKFFIGFFLSRETQFAVRAWPEQRVQTSAEHYRVPDVCLMRRSAPFEQIITLPPLLCIEVLSREDRMSDIQERVEDYLSMGVEMVWVVDPRRRKAFLVDRAGMRAAEELTVPGTEIRVATGEVFRELDELEGVG